MTKAGAENWTGNPYRRPNSPFWHIVFDDAASVKRRKSTRTKDLRIAREFLAATLREVEQQKTGHVDRFAETRKAPLSEVVSAYKQHLEAKGSSAQYVVDVMRYVRGFVAFAKIPTVPAIVLPDAERYLEDVSTRVSVRTRDHCAAALRAFGRWLRRTGRWDRDPFDGLVCSTGNKDKHRVFKRVSFRFEEAERLVEAVWARLEAERAQGGMSQQEHYEEDVRDRQVLYWFVLTTAFRASEAASIRWEDVTLDGPKLSVRLSGKFTKNGDDALIPLQPFVAEAMKKMRARRSELRVRRGEGPVQETDFVFHVANRIARLVRKDAAYAGLIVQRGPTSRRVDFHCLRKSCARILIELGVHPKIIQQTLRHHDIRLTMDLYGELGEDDLFRELPGKFPVPRMFAQEGHEGGSAAKMRAVP